MTEKGAFQRALTEGFEFYYGEAPLDFTKHIEPMGFISRGSVLIIGPDPHLAELMLIEPFAHNNMITSIDLVDQRPDYFDYSKTSKETFQSIYPQIQIRMHTTLFESFLSDKQKQFDTVLMVGRQGDLSQEEISLLSRSLTKGGLLFVTIDGTVSNTYELEKGASIKIVELPPHPEPDYNQSADGYHGLVLKVAD